MEMYLGEEILSWKKSLLYRGGRKVDLDWLLDIEGGLSWSDSQKILLYPNDYFSLQVSLNDLSHVWATHLETNKPLQHIICKCPWRDFVLEASPHALIPRQETELLIDFALSKFEKDSQGIWADLGTGSGAMAIAMARSLPKWEGHAVDCSQKALSLAIKNFKVLSPSSRVRFHLGNWWDPIKKLKNEFSLVLSNPPYIPNFHLKNLESIVRDNEPMVALCGGEDGLQSCRELVFGAIEGLCSGGWLMFEHHYDQSDQALNLMVDAGFQDVYFENDLQGIKRFAIGRHP